jgi:hypothetical protein
MCEYITDSLHIEHHWKFGPFTRNLVSGSVKTEGTSVSLIVIAPTQIQSVQNILYIAKYSFTG